MSAHPSGGSGADTVPGMAVTASMKFSDADFDAVRAVIVPLDTAERRERYRTGDFPRADRVKDLDMRYRWDLFHAADAWKLIDGRGYADTHIDTALRRIVGPLS